VLLTSLIIKGCLCKSEICLRIIGYSSDREKATVLNDYFCSVLTLEDGTCPTFDRRVASNVSISRIDISSNDVFKFITKCKGGMSSGPGGIPQYF